MEYYSDINRPMEPQKLIINLDVLKGVKALVRKYIDNNGLAIAFPLTCPDCRAAYGCDVDKLNKGIHSIIPNISDFEEYQKPIAPNPFDDTSDEGVMITDEQRTYDVLDLIEFVHKNIRDFKQDNYHSFFHHHHLLATDKTNTLKDSFAEDINDIFRRNQVAYKLNSQGHIERLVAKGLNALISVEFKTKDAVLNNLLTIATHKILNPKFDERKVALEKLWDAFERLKTIHQLDTKIDKNGSADKVIDKISCHKPAINEILHDEFKQLRIIGNDKVIIRHSEVDRHPITESSHVDYLFYRMMALIHLFLNYYNNA